MRNERSADTMVDKNIRKRNESFNTINPKWHMDLMSKDNPKKKLLNEFTLEDKAPNNSISIPHHYKSDFMNK